jgi:hypothetical protein
MVPAVNYLSQNVEDESGIIKECRSHTENGRWGRSDERPAPVIESRQCPVSVGRSCRTSDGLQIWRHCHQGTEKTR